MNNQTQSKKRRPTPMETSAATMKLQMLHSQDGFQHQTWGNIEVVYQKKDGTYRIAIKNSGSGQPSEDVCDKVARAFGLGRGVSWRSKQAEGKPVVMEVAYRIDPKHGMKLIE